MGNLYWSHGSNRSGVTKEQLAAGVQLYTYNIHYIELIFSNKSENCFRTVTITDLTCPIVKVSNAGAEDGLYEVIEDIRVKWAEERQVYKNSDSDRY